MLRNCRSEEVDSEKYTGNVAHMRQEEVAHFNEIALDLNIFKFPNDWLIKSNVAALTLLILYEDTFHAKVTFLAGIELGETIKEGCFDGKSDLPVFASCLPKELDKLQYH